jgi:integrase/recombinase XerC
MPGGGWVLAGQRGRLDDPVTQQVLHICSPLQGGAGQSGNEDKNNEHDTDGGVLQNLVACLVHATSCDGLGTAGEGLRRTETSRLDLADWGRNPAAAEFGRFGMLNVRYGKAKKGQPPRRRNVASVMSWAVEAVQDYVENIRPRFGCAGHPALWVTERGGRVKPAEINARFVAYRDALGLPAALVPHSIRHSYVSHLTEDGVDRRFIQVQVGHECDSSTAVYTHVSDDFMNTALRRALRPALDAAPDGRDG